jgi:hypothetical protein
MYLQNLQRGGRLDLPYLDHITRKLKKKTVAIKHEPKDGSEPMKFSDKDIAEFYAEDVLTLMEIAEMHGAYQEGAEAAKRQAEGNAPASPTNG